MHIDRLFLRFAAIAALATVLSCGNSDERRAEEALLTADSEEGGVQGLLSLNYEITSDVFKKWKTAQLGLDRALGKSQSRSLKAFILGERPTREAIERSVARIEGNPGAKRAIQDAGMSPRHYVVATVALFQATRGIDPVTGEAFRGLPARNVAFAEQNREEIETGGGEGEGEFQQIADSIAAVRAAARAASEGMQADTMSVQVDTVPRPVPLPAPIPVPMPAPTPVPPAPTPPTTPGAT
ncbi:MAG: hypothetical protein H0W42_06550 [Gemmatimonadaceae bacterium]|nr:hypothetical protein [Gemmatimonadaceae bacterium]